LKNLFLEYISEKIGSVEFITPVRLSVCLFHFFSPFFNLEFSNLDSDIRLCYVAIASEVGLVISEKERKKKYFSWDWQGANEAISLFKCYFDI
jgi:hypothetical protein